MNASFVLADNCLAWTQTTNVNFGMHSAIVFHVFYIWLSFFEPWLWFSVSQVCAQMQFRESFPSYCPSGICSLASMVVLLDSFFCIPRRETVSSIMLFVHGFAKNSMKMGMYAVNTFPLSVVLLQIVCLFPP